MAELDKLRKRFDELNTNYSASDKKRYGSAPMHAALTEYSTGRGIRGFFGAAAEDWKRGLDLRWRGKDAGPSPFGGRVTDNGLGYEALGPGKAPHTAAETQPAAQPTPQTAAQSPADIRRAEILSELPEYVAPTAPPSLTLDDTYAPFTEQSAVAEREQAAAGLAAQEAAEAQEAPEAQVAQEQQVPDYFQIALKELGLDNKGTQKLMALDAGRRLHSRDTIFNKRFDSQRAQINSKVAELQARDQLKQAKKEMMAEKRADRQLKRDEIEANASVAKLNYDAALKNLEATKAQLEADRAFQKKVHEDEMALKRAKKIEDIVAAEAEVSGRDKPATRKISATLRSLARRDEEFNNWYVGMKMYDQKAFSKLNNGAYDENAAGSSVEDYFLSAFEEHKNRG